MESEQKLGLIIAGSGHMGQVHARHWANIPEVELLAIVSRDPETAPTMTGAAGAQLFDDLATALAQLKDRVQIVDVCTPTSTHRDLAVMALSAGKHLFLEKPMARSIDECDAVIDAAERAGKTVMVGQVLRFFPQYRQAKRSVNQGAVGVPAAVRTARLAGPPTGGWKNWYADNSQSGGVVLDMIIHDFDWLRWTFGPVDRVFAKGLYVAAEHNSKLDYALCTLHHANGVLSHVAGSWAHTGGFRTTFEICGDAGMIVHDSDAIGALTIAQRGSGAGAAGVIVPESPMNADEDPYYLELRHFADCLLTGVRPEVGLADARAACEISLACLKSIETGEPVAIP